MKQHELGDLVTRVARRIRQDGRVLDLGREYALTLIDLYFQGTSNQYVHDFLFFAKHDGDPIYQGEKCDVSEEVAADEAVHLLEKQENWRALAFEHNLRTVYITVRRSVAAVKRFLVTGNPGGQVIPEDPMVPPMW